MTKLDISDLNDGEGAEQVVKLLRTNTTAWQLIHLYKNLGYIILNLSIPKTDIEIRNCNNLKIIKTKLFDAICDNADIDVGISDETIENVIDKW